MIFMYKIPALVLILIYLPSCIAKEGLRPVGGSYIPKFVGEVTKIVEPVYVRYAPYPSSQLHAVSLRSRRIGEGINNRHTSSASIVLEGSSSAIPVGTFLEVRLKYKNITVNGIKHRHEARPVQYRVLIDKYGTVVERDLINIEALSDALGNTVSTENFLTENLQNYFIILPRLGLRTGSKFNLTGNTGVDVIGEVAGAIAYKGDEAILINVFAKNLLGHLKYPIGYRIISTKDGRSLYSEVFLLIENAEGVAGQTATISMTSSFE